MSEEATETTPEEAQETQTAEQPAAPMFTQEQLNAAAAKSAAKADRKARREERERMASEKTPEPATGTEDGSSQLAQVLEQLQTRLESIEGATKKQQEERSFSEAISGIPEIDEDEREVLKLAFTGNREVFDRRVAAHRAKHSPPEPKGPGFDGIGAPNPIPAAERATNPNEWTADDVARFRADGSFLRRLKDYRSTLPGGGRGLFPAKNPAKG